MPARTRLPFALIALAIAASACASAPGTSSGPGGSPSSDQLSTSSQTSGAAPVVELLDFEAPLLDGGTFRGADLAGKDVAFWFWAPW